MRKITPQMFKILVVRFAGTFGSGMLSFAIGLYILHQTGSALSMGVSMITGPLVSLAVTPFVGYVIDTLPHKIVMVVAQVTTTIALIVFALTFRAFPSAYYPELIGLIIALQVTDNFLSTAITASLVQLFADKELQAVNSLNQSFSSLASFLAPIIGALVYTLVSIDIFAYIEVVFELIALLGIMSLQFKYVAAAESTPDEPHASVLKSFSAGLQYLLHQPLLLIISCSSAFINFLFAALNVGLPYLVIHTLKLASSEYGLIDSFFAVGIFVGGLALSQIKMKQHPVNFSYTFLMALGLILMFYAVPTLTGWNNIVNTIYFLTLSAVNGIILVFVNTPIGTLMQQVIPQKMQGRVFALNSTISQILAPLGVLVFGILFDHLAVLPIFIASGVAVILLTLGIMSYIKNRELLQSVDLPSDTESAAE